MKEYSKMDTLFKRDDKFNVIEGDFINETFEFMQDCKWIVTEKVDGTNIRIIWDGESFSIKGRTDKADRIEPLYSNILSLVESKKELFKDILGDSKVCIYGEGYGHKIQAVGSLYSNEQLFTAFDIIVGEHTYMDFMSMTNVLSTLGIPVVPVLGHYTIPEIVHLVKRGFASTLGNVESEGIVARPPRSLYSNNGKRIMFKLKTSDFRHGKRNEH